MYSNTYGDHVRRVVLAEDSRTNTTDIPLCRSIVLLYSYWHIVVRCVRLERSCHLKPLLSLYQIPKLREIIVVVKAPKSEGVVDPKSGERRRVSLPFEWQQGEEGRSERGFLEMRFGGSGRL
ncbi:hypothetical protein TNCV_251531 [Trichonephila clavipes]|nr:hypothetical protein TNCV_251531 [Trichonephila clavipes]